MDKNTRTDSDKKTLLITGASSGIGLALSEYYLNTGNRVIAIARNLEPLLVLQNRFQSQLIPVAMDVADRKSVVQGFASVQSIIQTLDVVILNAGTCEYVDVNNFSAPLFERVMAVNFNGAVNILEVILPQLLLPGVGNKPENATATGIEKAKRVSLVGVSSMAALLPMPRSQAYGASKVALEYLFNALRVDLAKQPIDITLVRPGFVKTPLTDKNDFSMPWLLDSAQAAKKIASGIASRKKIIMFPWPMVLLFNIIQVLPMSWQVALLSRLSRN